MVIKFGLTLARHAESTANAMHILQGQKDYPLSVTGKAQAKTLGRYLQSQKTFSHIYSSDLERAKDTALSVLEAQSSSGVSLSLDARLRERCEGEMEGKPLELLVQRAKKAKQSSLDFTPPGGENVDSVYARAVEFFLDLCERLEAELSSKSPLSLQADDATNSNHCSEFSEASRTICNNNACVTAPILLPSVKTQVSSQHNSAFESSTSCSAIHAQVLIVSHAGLLRELLRYFVDALCCAVPGGRGNAFRRSAHTALSSFVVTLDRCKSASPIEDSHQTVSVENVSTRVPNKGTTQDPESISPDHSRRAGISMVCLHLHAKDHFENVSDASEAVY